MSNTHLSDPKHDQSLPTPESLPILNQFLNPRRRLFNASLIGRSLNLVYLSQVRLVGSSSLLTLYHHQLPASRRRATSFRHNAVHQLRSAQGASPCTSRGGESCQVHRSGCCCCSGRFCRVMVCSYRFGSYQTMMLAISQVSSYKVSDSASLPVGWFLFLWTISISVDCIFALTLDFRIASLLYSVVLFSLFT